MSVVNSAKGIKDFENKESVTKARLQSDAVKPSIVSFGDPIPDADLFDSFLEQQNLSYDSGEARTALEKRSSRSPSIVLVNLKRLTFDAKKTIDLAKSKYRIPVICLIPFEDADKVSLIDSLGADEYLFKPFNPEEFACRVKLLLRRSGKHKDTPDIEWRSQVRRARDRKRSNDSTGTTGIRVQIDKNKKLIRFGDRKLVLTPKEFAFFSLLASEPGRVFSAEEIIGHLWSHRQRPSAANVHQCIYLLRKKIEVDVEQPRWIITVKGFGYKLNVTTD
jgi:two-component system alkaline phosphatase synthesis response regulator PhoP